MGYWDTPGRSDEWYTPAEVFDALGCRFDLDVAPARRGGDFVPEEVRDRLDEAYDRISKQHATVIGILHALVADPQEWPDIVAAEERGEARAHAALQSQTPGPTGASNEGGGHVG